LHFFTTNLTQDAEIISSGGYAEDLAFYSIVLPLSAKGMDATRLAIVYRWLLQPTSGDAWGGHSFSTEQDDTPAGAQAADGAQFMAFGTGPADPFSRSAAALSTGILGDPWLPNQQIVWRGQAQTFLGTLELGQQALLKSQVAQAVEARQDLKTQAVQGQQFPIGVGGGGINARTATLRVDTCYSYKVRLSTYSAAVELAVIHVI
jgi:hypothetical protein